MLGDYLNAQRMLFNIKKRMLDMAFQCNMSTHLSGALSMVDILAVLYRDFLRFDANDPLYEGRDRFILSKGHCVMAYYAILAEVGMIAEEELQTFQKDGSRLGAHPTMDMDIGIESSNGSLGQGISMAVGIAKAVRLKGEPVCVYTLLGNGECNEGSVWEAAMLAGQWGLSNLTVIVDHNKLQSDGESDRIISLANMAERWAVNGFYTVEINGHELSEIYGAFEADSKGKPKAIIAHTIKGHGVSFMENDPDWHHNRLSKKLYEDACRELEEQYGDF